MSVNNNDSNEFLLTSSFEEEIQNIVPHKKICPICRSGRRYFYCSYCITDGEFVHSSNRSVDLTLGSLDGKYINDNQRPQTHRCNAERFIEKKLKKDHLLRAKVRLLARIEDFLNEQIQCNRLRDQIVQLQCKVDLLKHACDKKKSQLQIDKLKYGDVVRRNKIYEQRCDKYCVKIEKARTYFTTYHDYIYKKKSLFKKHRETIIKLKRSHVENLIIHIFPLDVTELVVIDDDCHGSKVDEIAEASRLVYVDGQWVYSDSEAVRDQADTNRPAQTAGGGDTTADYWIVTPYTRLQPNDGNYTVYFTTPAVGGGVDEPDVQQHRCNTGFHRVAAALAYTTQLVNVLVNILDVNLPKQLCYSVFSSFTLDYKAFSKALKRLHRNVIYLCISQGVDAQNLRSKQMLHNLHHLIKSPQLANCSYYELDDDLLHSLEDSYHIVPPSSSGGGFVWGDVGGDDRSTDSNTDGDDDDDYDIQGWEAVPNLPYTELPIPQHVTSTASVRGGAAAEGFFGFAANSVTSWFRTATGGADTSTHHH